MQSVFYHVEGQFAISRGDGSRLLVFKTPNKYSHKFARISIKMKVFNRRNDFHLRLPRQS